MMALTRDAKNWTERWRRDRFLPGRPSPFGRTETGANDYRGVSHANNALRNLEIRDSDFSVADLHRTRIENCHFSNCQFTRANLTDLYIRSSRFENCQFDRADLRIAHIGYNGTEFDRCTFARVNVSRAGFLNAIFSNVCFDGGDWSRTDFCASGFWNCSFKGTLSDITFRGTYLFPYQREVAGEPRCTGLHSVDFFDAELHWVGVYNSCALEDITLPANGHAFMCNVNDLIAVSKTFGATSGERQLIDKYLQIIRPDPATQITKIISRNDLAKIGGDAGITLYSLLRSKLS